jgi:hypothetical protein
MRTIRDVRISVQQEQLTEEDVLTWQALDKLELVRTSNHDLAMKKNRH